jgi:tetratricopeptide (TPR) repeat protein
VEAEGRRLLACHGVRAAVEWIERVPSAERSTGLHCLHAEALALAGDLDAASAICLPLADSGAPDVARLLGHLEYRRGRPRQALEWYAKGPPDALLLAWTATAHWAIGDEAACREHADRAWRAATASGDQRALVASHVALGFAAEMVGDCAGEQHHYEKALALAEAAGDRVESARMRTNLSSRLLGEARFAEAAEMADQAVAQAEEVGYLTVLGIALCNGGDALLRLGDLAAACDRFERALAVEHTVGSQRLAYPLAGLGDVHRVRGRTSLAMASYEEAIRVCGAEGDRQGLVPALVGLALLLAVQDPDQAADLAERAHHDAVGPAAIRTLLTLGWVAQRRGDHQRAADLAVRTAEKARLHRDRARLAEALELLAAARPAKARSALGEARAIWRDTGARLDGRRITVLLGALPHASADERAEARAAREALVAQGVPTPVLAAPVHPPPTPRGCPTMHDTHRGAPAWRHGDYLTEEAVARGRQPAARAVHDGHRVLDRDELLAGVLEIALGASQRGQDQRGLAGDHVRPVQLGRHVDGQVAAAHGLLGDRRVRGGRDEVPAHGEEDLRLAVAHGPDRCRRCRTRARAAPGWRTPAPAPTGTSPASSPRCPWSGRPARWSARVPGTGPRRACRSCRAAAPRW